MVNPSLSSQLRLTPGTPARIGTPDAVRTYVFGVKTPDSSRANSNISIFVQGRYINRTARRKILYDFSRNLPFTHDRGISADRLEVPDLHVGMGARDDLDVGIRGVRLFNDLTGLKRLGDGSHRASGGSRIGR